MKRLLILPFLLLGCSQGLKIVAERTVDPVSGRLTGCRTEVLSGEDKATIAQARRSVTISEDCRTSVNFGSTEENAGDQVAKAITAVFSGMAPILKGGVK